MADEHSFDKNGFIGDRGNGNDFNSSGRLKKTVYDEILNNEGIQNTSDWWTVKFSRFGAIDPYNTMGGNREYLFFTQPDLHLFDGNTSTLNPELANNDFFYDCFVRYRHLMQQLQYSVSKKSPYLYVLTNSVTSPLELPDVVGIESESGENIYGDKINYRHGSESGDVGFDFSLEFDETKDLEIYTLFKLWDMYYQYKSMGRVTPPSDKYVTNMELHDQIAIYKIIVGEDMESILFYSKLYGVYPKGLPRSSFGSLENGPLKLSVEFHAAFVQDNRPNILADFNKLALNGNETIKSLKAAPLWDDENKRVSRKPVGKPFVIFDPNMRVPDGGSAKGTGGGYKLKWRYIK